TELFSHLPLKQLAPEALWDSLAMVMDGVMIEDKDLLKTVVNPGREHWLWAFNSQEAGEDMTRYTHGVPQVLRMLNSNLMQANSPTIRRLLQDKQPWDQAFEQLYFTTLARRPTPEERQLWEKHRDEVKNLETTYRSMLWVLLNSSEFVFNH